MPKSDSEALLLARRLEKYLSDTGHRRALRYIREVVDALVARIDAVTRTVAAINGSALVAAILITSPWLTDAQVARRSGLPPAMVSRDPWVAAIRRRLDDYPPGR